KNRAQGVVDFGNVRQLKRLLRIWSYTELIEGAPWNYAKNGACIRNKVKRLPMSLVAWITDLHSYFCYSHALDSTITGSQRQRRHKSKLDGYKLRAGNVEEEKNSGLGDSLENRFILWSRLSLALHRRIPRRLCRQWEKGEMSQCKA